MEGLMNRASNKGFIISLFILSIIFVFVFGIQNNMENFAYALTDGDWDDYASSELALLDDNLPNSQTNPYLIQSPQDLAYLSLSVNSGQSYEKKYFLQTQD